MSFERVEEYVKFYQDVVDRDLCVDVTMEKFPYEPSAYATHDSGKVVKNNRVTRYVKIICLKTSVNHTKGIT